MTITKLSICNGAMRLIKERQLSQNELTNNTREPARLFNQVWDDGGVRGCLEAGQWKFAKRTQMILASTSVGGEDFGFRYAFEKPEDFVRTIGVWADGELQQPLTRMREEGGFWVAQQDTIYVSYVSDDASFGGDYSLWPQTFLKFVQAHFAAEIAGPLTSEGSDALKARAMFLKDALSKDAMADPTRFTPVGSWVRARGRGRYSNDGQPR